MAPKSVELRETDAGLTLVGDNMELHCDFEEMLPVLNLDGFSKSCL